MTDDIIFDPETGLPQLDQDHAFEVDYAQFYGNKEARIEVDDDYDKRMYQVSIVKLEPIRFSKPEPVYEKNWIFQRISHYTEPKQLPRKKLDSFFDPIFTTSIIKKYNKSEIEEVGCQEAIDKYKRYLADCDKNGWKDKSLIYKTLELNDQNIKHAAIRVFKEWKAFQARELEREIERQKLDTLEEKYTGLYPPKGIKTDE